MQNALVEIFPAQSAEDAELARQLFQEYAAQLGVDLCFQGFERELAELPGQYAPPSGILLLAKKGGEVCACVAIRKLDDNSCEMKRLYLRPNARGHGLGRKLAEAAIDAARNLGYSRVVLDTLSTMHEAQGLYEKLGFREIPAYYDNPLPGARYLVLELSHDARDKRR